MPRSYRSIILALVGWLILANASTGQPNKAAPAKQAQRDQTVTAPRNAATTAEPKYAPYPNRYADPCYQASDHDAADLCAQWRAAYAAERAAIASERNNWISGGAAVLSFLSIVLVVIALRQGGEANRHARKANVRATLKAVANSQETQAALAVASRNADAAAEHVKIAQRAADLKLRPQFEIDKMRCKKLGLVFVAQYRVKNFGEASATDIVVKSGYSFTEVPVRSLPIPRRLLSSRHTTVAPGQVKSYTEAPCLRDDPRLEAIRNSDDLALVLTLKIAYAGPDGSREFTDSFLITEHQLKTGRMRRLGEHDISWDWSADE